MLIWNCNTSSEFPLGPLMKRLLTDRRCAGLRRKDGPDNQRNGISDA